MAKWLTLAKQSRAAALRNRYYRNGQHMANVWAANAVSRLRGAMRPNDAKTFAKAFAPKMAKAPGPKSM